MQLETIRDVPCKRTIYDNELLNMQMNQDPKYNNKTVYHNQKHLFEHYFAFQINYIRVQPVLQYIRN